MNKQPSDNLKSFINALRKNVNEGNPEIPIKRIGDELILIPFNEASFITKLRFKLYLETIGHFDDGVWEELRSALNELFDDFPHLVWVQKSNRHLMIDDDDKIFPNE